MPAYKPPPAFPIAAVLEELGAEAVPRVTGSSHAKMLCPFHPDRKPSASVSQYGFVCFTCGVTGDAIRLIREEERLSYEAAVQRCAEITGVENRNIPPASGWGGTLLD